MLAINVRPPSDYRFAEQGYDSHALRCWLLDHGTTPMIPSRSNRKVQISRTWQNYRQRNFVERVPCRFMEWRRIRRTRHVAAPMSQDASDFHRMLDDLLTSFGLIPAWRLTKNLPDPSGDRRK